MKKENSNVKTNFSPVRIAAIKSSKYSDGYTVQLKQEKSSAYLPRTVNGDFNIPTKSQFTSSRNYFINDIDVKDKEEAKKWSIEFLKRNPNLHIKRLTSHSPIILGGSVDDETYEKMKNSQLVKNGNGEIVRDELDREWYALSVLCQEFEEDEFIDSAESGSERGTEKEFVAETVESEDEEFII